MGWSKPKKNKWQSRESNPFSSIRAVINTILDVVPGGVIRAGKTSYTDTSTGFWLGIDTNDGLAKFHVGNESWYMRWTGTNLEIQGTISGLIYGTVETGGTNANTWTVNQNYAAGTARVELPAAEDDTSYLYYDGTGLRINRNLLLDSPAATIDGVDISNHAGRHGQGGADELIVVSGSQPAETFPGLIWVDTS